MKSFDNLPSEAVSDRRFAPEKSGGVSETLDFEQIAHNVRCLRMAHDMTQVELARQAGVDPATVYRLERGSRIHRRNLLKVAEALDRPVAMLAAISSYGPPTSRSEPYLQRGTERVWHAFGDRRTQPPPDSHKQIQDERERMRLGRTGLVPLFMSFGFAMPDGPGMTTYEVHGKAALAPLRTYRDGIFYGLRGEVLISVAGSVIRLQAGDALGMRADHETLIEPARPRSPEEIPPLVLHVAANRVGQLPASFRSP